MTAAAPSLLGSAALEAMFHLLPLPAAVLRRRDGVVLAANAGYAALLGCEPGEIVGHSLQQLGLGIDGAARRELLRRLDAAGRVRGLEARLRTKSGACRDVLKHLEFIDFLEEPCVLNVNVDITARRRAEDELRRNEERLASIIDTAMDAIITVDAAHRVVVFNHAAETMFGVSAAEAMGLPIDRFVPPQHRAGHSLHMAMFEASGQNTRAMGRVRELSGVRANGEVFPIEASISRAGEGDRASMTVMARDVTLMRRAERGQIDRVAAEAANRAKTDLLSRVSHELRTPLNAILGFTQLMQAEMAPAEHTGRQGERLALVRQAGLQLKELIDEILDLSQVEAGRISVEMQRVELCGLLDGVLRLSQPHAQASHVSLHADHAGRSPVWVRADPARLRQVMLNLVSNAIKYNRPGREVRVDVVVEGASATIAVRDGGLGMTQQQMSGLFQPFNRLGRESGPVEGVGLGLVLARQILLLMGGGLSLDSVPDVGSVARVTLPTCDGEAPPAPAPPLQAAAPGAAPSGVVLYIEDNPVNAVLVEHMLRPWSGVRLLLASEGRSGLEMARTHLPDLVLLDLHLPDIDGLEVLRALKSDALTSALPVVILSANAMPAQVEELRAAGAVDYWTKPLQIELFTEGVRQWLSAPPLPG